MNTIYKLLPLLMASALFFSAGESRAQDYPDKPIKIIVAYTPGGMVDTIARAVAQKLSKELGQSVIVENKPGAEARIGTKYVAKSAPDGYTLLLGATGQMVYNPGLYGAALPYDPIADFAPITLLGRNSLVFAVKPDFPAKSMKDFIALAKAKPGGLFYSTGATPFYVAAEALKKMTGMNIVNVPFKGNVQAINAALAGNVQLVVADLPTTLPQLRAGTLRALAVTSRERSKFLPDTPTLLESGLDFSSRGWAGLFAPAGTPRPIIDKLYRAMSAALKSEDVSDILNKLSFETSDSGMPPQQFAAMHKADVTKWVKIMNNLNIHGDNWRPVPGLQVSRN